MSVESASESASSGFNNISVAAGDQGIFMGFHNAMIMIKHRHFGFPLYWHPHKLMDHCTKEALVNCYHVFFIAFHFLYFVSGHNQSHYFSSAEKQIWRTWIGGGVVVSGLLFCFYCS